MKNQERGRENGVLQLARTRDKGEEKGGKRTNTKLMPLRTTTCTPAGEETARQSGAYLGTGFRG